MKCLVLFNHDNHWIDFREAELNSLLKFHNIEPSEAYVPGSLKPTSAFLEINFPNEQVIRQICSRSVLIRAVYELWSYSDNIGGVISELKLNGAELAAPFQGLTYSLEIEAFYRTLTPPQKQMLRDHFSILDLTGTVKVVDPELTLTGIFDFSANMHCSEEEFVSIPTYFGRFLARGGMKEEIKKYDLKKRGYLGPTSLDHSLALILANLAAVVPGTLALDPFVGTGSILIALTHFGARCTGTDIDPRVLRGDMHAGKQSVGQDSSTRNIFGNFSQYGLEPPELIRLDNHLADRHYHISPAVQSEGWFDCIVTDPPYGIRAGAKKSGRKDPCTYTVSEAARADHIPSTQNYPVEEVMLDLLHLAASLLVIGGSLVYLIPTTYDFLLSDLPTHPCLEIKLTCEQALSSRHGRRAVLMTKHSHYVADKVEEYKLYKESVANRQDAGFGMLIDKLERALAVNAFHNDQVVKRASQGCIKRKESKAKRIRHRQESSGTSEGATAVTAAEADVEAEIEVKDQEGDGTA